MGRRYVQFSAWSFCQLLTEGPHRFTVKPGLPADARIVAASIDATNRPNDPDLVIVIESESFGPTLEGEPYPEIAPLFRVEDA